MPIRWFRADEGYTRRDLAQAARDHLFSAQILFGKGPFCFDSAGYLSHLSIELLLKAILLDARGSFPNEHSLPKLLRVVRQSVPALSVPDRFVDPLELINRFGDLRYPDPQDAVEIGTDDWPEIEKLFWHLVHQYLPLLADIEARATEHGTFEKGGRVLLIKDTPNTEEPSDI